MLTSMSRLTLCLTSYRASSLIEDNLNQNGPNGPFFFTFLALKINVMNIK